MIIKEYAETQHKIRMTLTIDEAEILVRHLQVYHLENEVFDKSLSHTIETLLRQKIRQLKGNTDVQLNPQLDWEYPDDKLRVKTKG